MSDEEKIVLVDTDFINHILSAGKDYNDGERLLSELFSNMECTPYVHPWVADNEFVSTKLKSTISKGIIKKLSWCKLIGNDKELLDFYQFNVCDLYEKLMGVRLDLKGQSIVELRMSQSSVGEVQSVIAAQQLEISIFCSNDHSSKDLATLVNNSTYELKVYNVAETLTYISKMPETSITFEECKSIVHNAIPKNTKLRKSVIKTIKDNYSQNNKLK